jgi:peroxiredoxin Q/BCP
VTVAAGDPVADFTLPSTQGPFNLAQARSSTLVLYFYPKDNTPGCTNESADFRDLHPQFVAAGAVVCGVSRDSLRSHESFSTKLGLPFALLSDADETLCQQFGVIKLKNMYGKQVRGIERSTFVMSPAGVLVREWRGVKVPGHAAEVLAFVQSMS